MKWTGERVVPDDMHTSVITYQEHLIRYVFALQYCVGKRVLDASCGAGYGSDLLSAVAEIVVGVDVSDEALRYARARYARPAFVRMDLESPALADDAFDTVVSFETIEHLEDPDRFLGAVRRSLTHGGIFIWSIPRMIDNDYHRHLYEFCAASKLISRHFPNTLFLRQDRNGVTPTTPHHGPYFLGVSRL